MLFFGNLISNYRYCKHGRCCHQTNQAVPQGRLASGVQPQTTVSSHSGIPTCNVEVQVPAVFFTCVSRIFSPEINRSENEKGDVSASGQNIGLVSITQYGSRGEGGIKLVSKKCVVLVFSTSWLCIQNTSSLLKALKPILQLALIALSDLHALSTGFRSHFQGN